MKHRFHKLTALVAALAVPAALMVSLSATTVHAAAPKALILGPSVRPGSARPQPDTRSLEEQKATADGFAVTVVTAAQWGAMTAAEFRAYQVLILGDGPDASGADAAIANKSVWEPVVMSSGGNRIVIASDPTFHYVAGKLGAGKFEAKGIAYAGAVTGATGLYFTLRGAYAASPGTDVPLLDGLTVHPGPKQFTVNGKSPNTALVVATTPQTAGLTGADLSNWNSSVHGYFETWPSDWTPLAVATGEGIPLVYSAFQPGTTTRATGSPYILISLPATVKSDITLTPPSASKTVGGSTTVTATVLTTLGAPFPGITVRFYVEAGPNKGKSGTGVTAANGVATFTYTGTGGVGADTVSGVFNPPGSLVAVIPTPQQKNFAQVVWAAAVVVPSPSPTAIGLPKAGATRGGVGSSPTLAILALTLLAIVSSVAWRVASPRRRGDRSN